METAAIDIGAFTTALSGVVEVADVVTLLASIVGIGAAFVLAWFGVRKAYKMFMNAVQGKKTSL